MASWDGMGQGVFWIQAGKDRNARLEGVGQQRRLAGGVDESDHQQSKSWGLVGLT